MNGLQTSLWRTAMRLSNFILDFCRLTIKSRLLVWPFLSQAYGFKDQTAWQADVSSGRSETGCVLTEVFGGRLFAVLSWVSFVRTGA